MASRNRLTETRQAREKRYAAREVTDKLGIKPGDAVRIVGKIDAALASRVRAKIGRAFVGDKENVNVVLFVPGSLAEITPTLRKLKRAIVPNGGIWVITSKKDAASVRGVPYVPDQILIPFGLAAGLVDNKICSVSATESAIRFVIRREDR